MTRAESDVRGDFRSHHSPRGRVGAWPLVQQRPGEASSRLHLPHPHCYSARCSRLLTQPGVGGGRELEEKARLIFAQDSGVTQGRRALRPIVRRRPCGCSAPCVSEGQSRWGRVKLGLLKPRRRRSRGRGLGAAILEGESLAGRERERRRRISLSCGPQPALSGLAPKSPPWTRRPADGPRPLVPL